MDYIFLHLQGNIEIHEPITEKEIENLKKQLYLCLKIDISSPWLIN